MPIPGFILPPAMCFWPWCCDAATIDGYVYCGFDGSSATGSTARYSRSADSWTTRASASSKSALAGTTVSNKQYAIGGENSAGDVLDENKQYTPATNIWANKATLSQVTRNFDGFAALGNAYVAGGVTDPFSTLDDTAEYSVSGDAWSAKTAITPARQFGAGTQVGGKGYISGGADASFVPLGDHDEYDPSGDSWAAKANIPSPNRNVASSTSVETTNKLYLAGGSTGANDLADNDEYDASGDSWTSKTDMISGRRVPSGFTVGGKPIFTCGSASGSPIGDVQEYDPSGDSWSTLASVSARTSHEASEA